MGISQEEQLRRLKSEKITSGEITKWLSIISSIYFILMVFYEPSPGILLLAGGTFIVSIILWLKQQKKIKTYRWQLENRSNKDIE